MKKIIVRKPETLKTTASFYFAGCVMPPQGGLAP